MLITLLPGPSFHSPVERRDHECVPSLIADPRWNEPESPQQIRRRHRRTDDHGEPTDHAARPQQQRLLNALWLSRRGGTAPTFRCSLQGVIAHKERVKCMACVRSRACVRSHAKQGDFCCGSSCNGTVSSYDSLF